jgi:hypothetical protein
MEQIAPYVHHTLATVSSHEKQALRMNRKVSLETGVCAYEGASSSSNYEKKAKYVKESQRIVFCFFYSMAASNELRRVNAQQTFL